MRILFVHQNFPAQFSHLAPALAADPDNQVIALTMQQHAQAAWQGVHLLTYPAARAGTPHIHPWVGDFGAQAIHGEAAMRAALVLRDSGFTPDVIIADPEWGESLFLKDVWPQAKLGICSRLYHHADAGFDPEFEAQDPGEAGRLRLKNLNHLLHFDIADAGIAPTQWQAATFPEPFRSRITVAPDGIDCDVITPNPAVSLTLNGTLTLTRDDEVITFASRNLEPRRGYHIFMRALPEILQRRPKARVLIAGGEGARSPGGAAWRDVFLHEVKDRFAPQDLQRVHFLGNLPYEVFIPLLQLSTVHVHLSYPRVPSRSLLEAMSAGCAIVGSDTSPVRELITHNKTGRLVDFFDVEALSAQVGDLLEQRLEGAWLGANARIFAQEKHDLRTACLPKQLAWVKGLMP